MKSLIYKILFQFAFVLSVVSGWTQIHNPVKWEYQAVEKGDEITLRFVANIDSSWHIYAMDIPDVGPVATEIRLKSSEQFSLVGKVEQGQPIKKMDKTFGEMLSFFDHKAVFTQKIKAKDKDKTEISGEITYMVCNDEMCLPPEDLEFNVKLKDLLANRPDEASSGSVWNNEDIASGFAPKNEIFEPVKWNFSSQKQEDGNILVRLNANIDDGWHLYAINLPSEEGPFATTIGFKANKGIKLLGEAKEPTPITAHDPNYDLELNYFEHKVEFTQLVELQDKSSSIIEGQVEFMVCDEERCLPPEIAEFKVDLITGKQIKEANAEAAVGQQTNVNIATVDLQNPEGECGESNLTSKKGLMTLFFLGFAGGLVALLTPCVFPMIPLTVSFFTKGSSDKSKGIKNSITYGFFIFFIYILLSLPFHFLDSIDPHILNNISTNVTLNVIFFVVFVVFAISFFGYFEITIPNSWSNKVDSASGVGGLIGIFLMALTLALVSFSCTGPILGSLLAGSLSSNGGAIQLTAGMGGFGLALGLPFGLFAAFPGVLNNLPKSGGWLTSVKVVLGFVELALAIKFLSNADLVEHWGILKREVFIGLWIVIGIGLGLYLLGKIKFPHDSKLVKLSKLRLGLALLVFAFVGYLVPGVTNTKAANLKLLSGFPPPLFYSIYEKSSKCPLELNCFKDYDQGMAYARENNKPVLLDFTGWACVNCRKMEENVWVNPEVYKLLQEDFVLISLYVDDRAPLPKDQQFEYVREDGRKKKIKTIGNKWSTMQTETFANNSQPYYALLSPDEKLLSHPVGYTPDIEEYNSFLKCGLDAFKER